MIASIGVLLTGSFLLAGRSSALALYAVVLFVTTIWSLYEVGLDWWQLVPRLSLWFVLGVVLWLPWFCRPLVLRKPAPKATAALGAAVILAGACAVGAQFTNPGEIYGDLGRDGSDMASVAPVQPEGEWQSYGRTEFGERYPPLKQITPQNVGRLKEAWRIRTGDMPTA